MTNENKQLSPAVVIGEAERKFHEITDKQPLVEWQKESMFAMQAIEKNSYSYSIAMQNPKSLRNAVINIAAIGLSLNPATAYAYLVPRDKAICLDISYQGLIKIATDTGSILWARADLVYETDKFTYRGPAEKPEIQCDPFGNRGGVVGAYCIAKTHDGDYLTEIMSADEIQQVKLTSPSAVKGKGPWIKWPGEMAKKTVIKRASKTWPKSEQIDRLREAIDITNIADEVGVEAAALYTEEQKKRFDACMKYDRGYDLFLLVKEVGEEGYISLANTFPKGTKTKNKAKLRTLEEEGIAQFKEAFDMLKEAIDNQDDPGIAEILSDTTEFELNWYLQHLNDYDRQQAEETLTRIKRAAA